MQTLEDQADALTRRLDSMEHYYVDSDGELACYLEPGYEQVWDELEQLHELADLRTLPFIWREAQFLRQCC